MRQAALIWQGQKKVSKNPLHLRIENPLNAGYWFA
jgi:hypothetical protein